MNQGSNWNSGTVYNEGWIGANGEKKGKRQARPIRTFPADDLLNRKTTTLLSFAMVHNLNRQNAHVPNYSLLLFARVQLTECAGDSAGDELGSGGISVFRFFRGGSLHSNGDIYGNQKAAWTEELYLSAHFLRGGRRRFGHGVELLFHYPKSLRRSNLLFSFFRFKNSRRRVLSKQQRPP
jgi:hypothetical protein